MSKFFDVKDVTHKFKTDVELRDYAAQQFKLLSQANERIASLEGEIEHLKTLLIHGVPIQNAAPQKVELVVSVPQAILEAQIERLKDRAFEEDLDLEDTKRLEILVRSLKIIQDVDKEKPKKTKATPALKDEDLLLLAKLGQKPAASTEEDV